MSYSTAIISYGDLASTGDNYYPLCMSDNDTAYTTSAYSESKIYGSGIIKNLRAYIQTNTSGSSETINLRINNASVNQSLTIGAGVTGHFVDTTNTDSFASGDTVNIFYNRTGSSTTVSSMGADVKTAGDITARLGTFGNVTWANNNSARYNVLAGEVSYGSGAGITEDTVRKFKLDIDGTIKNLATIVTGNARVNAVTIRVRVNGADGNGVISVGAGLTGFFSDTSNTDTVAIGDTANYSIFLGGGGGNFTSSYMGCDLVGTTAGKTQAFASSITTASNVINGVTRYGSLFGRYIIQSGEAPTSVYMYSSGTIKNLRVYSAVNGGSTACVCTVRKNGADTALTTTITASTTGEFSDVTNSFTYVAGDRINIKYVRAAGSGSTTISRISMEIDQDNEFIPSIRYY